MSSYVGLIGYEALLGVTGYGLLVGLGIARGSLGDWKLSGLAFLVGWEVVGVVGSIALMLGLRIDLASFILLAVAAGAASANFRFFIEPLPRVAPRRTRFGLRIVAWAGGAVIVLAASAALVGAFTGSADPEWDSWAMWVPKAEVIYYWHGLNGAISTYPAFAHPEYPPLWPLTGAGVFAFAGGFHPALLPLQQALLGVSFIASAAVLLTRRVPGWFCLPALATVAVAPGFWWRLQTFLPDQTVAYAVAVAALCGILWMNERRGAWLALSSLSLAAAALTKLEGVTLGLALAAAILAAMVAQDGRRGLKSLWLLVGPAAIIPWRLWLANHKLPGSSPDYSWEQLLHPVFLANRVGRLEIASQHMVGFISRSDQWLLVLPLAAVTLALSLRRLVAPTLAIIAWSLMSFLGLAAIYWIGWLGIDYYISSSANRVSSTLPIVVGTTAPLLLGLAFDGTWSEARGFAARSWPRRSTRKRVTADALTDAPLGRSG